MTGRIISASLLLLPALPALAQETAEAGAAEPKAQPLSAVFTNMTAFTSLLISLAGAYVLSVAITALFSQRYYPPNVARVGCGVTFSIWLLCFLGLILGYILKITLQPLAWVLVCVLILLLLVILYKTRRPVIR